MYLFNNHFRTVLSGAMLLVCATFADAAGLVGYRNDTPQAVVVQSTVVSNGMTRRSRPQTLLAGDVALDTLAFTGPRTITVYDARNPTTILFQGDVNSTEDLFFSIQPRTTVPIKGQAPTTPKVELVRTKPPAMPKPRK